MQMRKTAVTFNPVNKNTIANITEGKKTNKS